MIKSCCPSCATTSLPTPHKSISHILNPHILNSKIPCAIFPLHLLQFNTFYVSFCLFPLPSFYTLSSPRLPTPNDPILHKSSTIIPHIIHLLTTCIFTSSIVANTLPTQNSFKWCTCGSSSIHDRPLQQEQLIASNGHATPFTPAPYNTPMELYQLCITSSRSAPSGFTRPTSSTYT